MISRKARGGLTGRARAVGGSWTSRFSATGAATTSRSLEPVTETRPHSRFPAANPSERAAGFETAGRTRKRCVRMEARRVKTRHSRGFSEAEPDLPRGTRPSPASCTVALQPYMMCYVQ